MANSVVPTPPGEPERVPTAVPAVTAARAANGPTGAPMARNIAHRPAALTRK